MGIIMVIIMFFLLIIWHEFGHYIVAQLSKVKVLEFGIWIPPKISKIRTTKQGTQITINLIPLGWFVRLKGEDPQSKSFLEKDSFIKASLIKKIMILLGGIIANIMIAYILLVVAFSYGVKPMVIIPNNAWEWSTNSLIMPDIEFAQKNHILDIKVVTGVALVEEVLPWGRAYELGITSWSIITAIAGNVVNNQNLKSVLANNINKDFKITRTKSDKTFEKSIDCNQDCLLGIVIHDESEYTINETKWNIQSSARLAAKEIKAQTQITFQMLKQIGQKLTSSNQKDRKEALENLSWPVWATKIGSLVRENAWKWEFLTFIAILSLALAIFNLLPIPALDGWRLVSVIIQSISRSKPQKYYSIENYVNIVFFVILLIGGMAIIVKDLHNFRWF